MDSSPFHHVTCRRLAHQNEALRIKSESSSNQLIHAQQGGII